MSIGQDLEIPIWPKKFDVRIIFFRLGRLQMLLLKNHIVREVGPFPMSCHIYVTHFFQHLSVEKAGHDAARGSYAYAHLPTWSTNHTTPGLTQI